MSFSDEEIRAVVRNALELAETAPLEVIPLAARGSRRSFYRIHCGDYASVVFMYYSADRRENRYYADLGRFLQKIGVPAPLIFHHDPEKNFLLMEDLGETDLWQCRQLPWEIRKTYYFKTLSIISRLHAFRRENFPSTDVSMMEAFNRELYSWERDYFLQNFVQAFCGIVLSVSEAAALEKELASLADRLFETAHCLIHRDLQSQNVMICDEEPVLIDFQGMRYGNLFYDLGSLLYDPYVSFTEGERQELLDYYYGLSQAGYDLRTFHDMFRRASVQRLMQALGAYGFLGLKENRREFLVYIPSGLKNLIEATGTSPAFDLLREIAFRCRASLAKTPDV